MQSTQINIENSSNIEGLNEVENKPKKKLSYTKWGYIFIASFFVIYLIFTLVPQLLTIYDSFFDYDPFSGILVTDAHPEFCGFLNYQRLFQENALGVIEIYQTIGNTLIMWIIGAIPQMVIALILALIFTSTRLKLKGTGFFKTAFYMPNLIMASAFSALFLMLFSQIGPVYTLFKDMGWIPEHFDFVVNKTSARLMVAFLNFIMWFGNTTILLMAGIQSIDESIFESARIDGASTRRVLFDMTLPLLKPIVVYVLITSMIGGLQMFDVPQVLTNKAKNSGTRTIIMLLNDYLNMKNYGRAGAISVILFIITAVLSIFVFKTINKKEDR
jgi:multiple sugar transport system permease protein